MTARLLILPLLALLAASASAAEYFVSTTGDDSASGTSRSTAFATIAKGVNVLQPGDTLTILPGEYFESINAKVAGTADAPITIRAERPGTVLMRGDVDVSGFEPAPGLRGVFVTKFDQRVESVAERSTRRTCIPKLSPKEVEMELATYYHDEEEGLLYIHSSDSRSPDLHSTVVSVTNGCGLAFVEPGAGHHVTVDGLSFTGYSHRDYQTMHGSRTRWGIMVPRCQTCDGAELHGISQQRRDSLSQRRRRMCCRGLLRICQQFPLYRHR